MYNEETIKSVIKFNKMSGKEIKRLKKENEELKGTIEKIVKYLSKLHINGIEFNYGLGKEVGIYCEKNFKEDIFKIIGDI